MAKVIGSRALVKRDSERGSMDVVVLCCLALMIAVLALPLVSSEVMNTRGASLALTKDV